MATIDLTTPVGLARAAESVRRRTLALVDDLDDAQLLGPRLGTVNPLRWEVGHVGWFTERWTLRRDGQPSVRDDADALYDSIAIPHGLRWDLPLPDRAGTLAYLEAVAQRATAQLHGDPSDDDLFHQRYALGHEDMHVEAFLWARQTLGYPTPRFCADADDSHGAGPWTGDVTVPAGAYPVGAGRDEGFCFDNEKWRHDVALPSFAIARAPVTVGEYLEFVEGGGYANDGAWSPAGRAWKTGHGKTHPVHWRRTEGGWEQRRFDRWVPLRLHAPVIHVSWYEAEAWCAWAGRRLPSEAEWEVAASWDPTASRARRYPWGDAIEEDSAVVPANLDATRTQPVDVAAFEQGDSPLGCRQMIGNVWEWTSDWFSPYDGFCPDPYREYSQPWFSTHRVLRGGSLMASGRLVTNRYRNFAVPTRNDLFAGFRTCAR